MVNKKYAGGRDEEYVINYRRLDVCGAARRLSAATILFRERNRSPLRERQFPAVHEPMRGRQRGERHAMHGRMPCAGGCRHEEHLDVRFPHRPGQPALMLRHSREGLEQHLGLRRALERHGQGLLRFGVRVRNVDAWYLFRLIPGGQFFRRFTASEASAVNKNAWDNTSEQLGCLIVL